MNLHRTAACIVVEKPGGEIPSNPAVFVKLPDVGPYTAEAVACVADAGNGLHSLSQIVRTARKSFVN